MTYKVDSNRSKILQATGINLLMIVGLLTLMLLIIDVSDSPLKNSTKLMNNIEWLIQQSWYILLFVTFAMILISYFLALLFLLKKSKIINKNYYFKINLLLSSFCLGSSHLGTLGESIAAIQIDIINMGNNGNYIDFIKFITIQNNKKKYFQPVINPNDQLSQKLYPEFGQLILPGKKTSYYIRIDDLSEVLLNADNKFNFNVLVKDESGNDFEISANQSLTQKIEKYFTS